MKLANLISQEIQLVATLLEKIVKEAAPPAGNTDPPGGDEPMAPEGTPTDAMADPGSMTSDAPDSMDATGSPESPDGTSGPDASGLGGSVGGGSSGVSGFGGFSDSGSDSGAGDSEESDDSDKDSKEKPDEPADPVAAVMDTATTLSQTTRDTPQILKALKAGMQDKFSDPEQTQQLVQQLSQSKNPTLIDAGKRLNQFLRIREEKMNKLQEDKLRGIVSKLVEKKIKQLKEDGSMPKVMASIGLSPKQESSAGDANFDAVRSLGLKAQQTALVFESDMRKELDLLDPNKMDKNSQEIYAKAMTQFHATMVAAVTDAVNAVKALPKNKQDEQ